MISDEPDLENFQVMLRNAISQWKLNETVEPFAELTMKEDTNSGLLAVVFHPALTPHVFRGFSLCV